MDDAGRSTDADLFPVLGYFPGPKYILVGDHHQIPPRRITNSLARHNLAPQMSMSLLQRLRKNGFPSVVFDEQHRMIPLIGDLVSDIFYSGKLRNASSTNDRELSTDVCNYNQERFGIDSPIVLVNLEDSRDDKQSPIQARVNLDNVRVVLDLAIDLVITKSIVKPEDVLVITPYDGQSAQYSVAVDNCAKDNNPMIQTVNWRKIDVSQGDEAEDVILDLTVQSSIGFMKVPNELNVGLSRAKLVLYIVGNDKIFKESSWKRKEDCKYMLQLWQRCADMDIIADIKGKPDCKYAVCSKYGDIIKPMGDNHKVTTYEGDGVVW